MNAHTNTPRPVAAAGLAPIGTGSGGRGLAARVGDDADGGAG